jgi:hypothetical protein
LDREKTLEILNAANILDDKSKQITHLQLCIGARVLITSNLGIALGLMNGTLGTVVGFLYGDPDADSIPHYAKHIIMPECPTADMAAQNQPALPIVLVQIDEIYSKLKNSYLRETSNIVPIAPLSREITWKKQEQISGKMKITEEKIYRTQLPLILAKFATIHKIQGVSVDQLVWILGPQFAMGLSYVAMSRVTSFNGLYIIPSNKNKSITAEYLNSRPTLLEKASDEYNRLENSSMPEEFNRIESQCQKAPQYSKVHAFKTSQVENFSAFVDAYLNSKKSEKRRYRYSPTNSSQ